MHNAGIILRISTHSNEISVSLNLPLQIFKLLHIEHFQFLLSNTGKNQLNYVLLKCDIFIKVALKILVIELLHF